MKHVEHMLGYKAYRAVIRHTPIRELTGINWDSLNKYDISVSSISIDRTHDLVEQITRSLKLSVVR